MNKIISFTLLVIGIALIVISSNASHSAASDFSRFFTGAPTDKTIWLLIAGGFTSIIGAAGLFVRPKNR